MDGLPPDEQAKGNAIFPPSSSGQFRYQDHLGKARRYYHPECDEGPWASEIALEESGLAERQIMKFRFDFGDDWRFRLLLERIDPSGGAADIQVIGAEGPSPKQYPTQE